MWKVWNIRGLVLSHVFQTCTGVVITTAQSWSSEWQGCTPTKLHNYKAVWQSSLNFLLLYKLYDWPVFILSSTYSAKSTDYYSDLPWESTSWMSILLPWINRRQRWMFSTLWALMMGRVWIPPTFSLTADERMENPKTSFLGCFETACVKSVVSNYPKLWTTCSPSINIVLS